MRKTRCAAPAGPRRTSALALGALSLSLLASVASATPTREPEQPRPSCPSLEAGRYPVTVRWGEPRSTAGCFFFSGPGQLGRDDQLGARAQLSWEGDRVSLAFGPAVFEGTVSGNRVVLERRSRHDFGNPWDVTERIEGTLAEVERGGAMCRAMRANYAYQEQPAGQPPGHCTIASSLTVMR